MAKEVSCPLAEAGFSRRILAWYQDHGRHDLPWQKERSLYSVWVSEIMLQQTQVSTVIPYYQRFMQSFPALEKLAEASQDEVLNHWAGLGYYTRARNLHKAARLIVEQHHSQFPTEYTEVIALPGIGPSTAAAVLSQALDQPHTILDGNVKRLLARYHGVEGWPGQRHIENRLWQYAEQHTPQHQVADYTQAIMDMGATVCRRSSPTCDSCPVSADCVALKQGKVEELPTKRPKKTIPVREKRLLCIENKSLGLLMEKRPSTGIWGGLWSLPELALDEDVKQVCEQRWGLKVQQISDQKVFRHTFSHFHLDITPCKVQVELLQGAVREDACYQWQSPDAELAVSTPVRHILNTLLNKAPENREMGVSG